MTVSNQSSAVTYLGNGAVTQWFFSFPVDDASWLQVKTKDSTGVLTTVPASEYDVTGIGSPGGGSVYYPKVGNPLQPGYRIRIQRVVPIVQNVNIVNQEAIYPDVMEGSADYKTFVDQQLLQRIMDLEAGDTWL